MEDGVPDARRAAERKPSRRPGSSCRQSMALQIEAVVVLNKIDRTDARQRGTSETFDLFVGWGPTTKALDFPVKVLQRPRGTPRMTRW